MFDFCLLRSLPRPKKTLFFCILFFGCCACPYWINQPGTTPEALHGSLHDFLRSEQGSTPKQPQILIAGSSLSGMGFHVGELEKRFGMPAAKIPLSGSTPKDMLDILECYPAETQHAQVMFLELVPARLTVKQDGRRKRFFDGIRPDIKINTEKSGITTVDFSSTTGFLRRSSMPHFIGGCIKPLHYLAKTWERHRYELPPPRDFYEDKWDDPTYKDEKNKYRIQCRYDAQQILQGKKEGNAEKLPLMFGAADRQGKIVYEEEQFKAVYQLLNLCRCRNIFLVICIMPQWQEQLQLTQESIEHSADDPYLSLLHDLDCQADCSVIICRDFKEITDEGTDEDYLFDYGHMTRKGAMVYTNWLADRLLTNSKTARHFPALPALPKVAEILKNRD